MSWKKKKKNTCNGAPPRCICSPSLRTKPHFSRAVSRGPAAELCVMFWTVGQYADWLEMTVFIDVSLQNRTVPSSLIPKTAPSIGLGCTFQRSFWAFIRASFPAIIIKNGERLWKNLLKKIRIFPRHFFQIKKSKSNTLLTISKGYYLYEYFSYIWSEFLWNSYSCYFVTPKVQTTLKIAPNKQTLTVSIASIFTICHNDSSTATSHFHRQPHDAVLRRSPIPHVLQAVLVGCVGEYDHPVSAGPRHSLWGSGQGLYHKRHSHFQTSSCNYSVPMWWSIIIREYNVGGVVWWNGDGSMMSLR